MDSTRSTNFKSRSARGNTLVGVLIGMVIIEVAATGVITAMSQFSKTQAMLDAKSAGQSLAAAMSDELTTLTTCAASVDRSKVLTQDASGHWPLAMKISTLPTTPLETNGAALVGDYGLRVGALYVDKLTDTEVLGPAGKKLFTGNVVAQFAGTGDAAITMRPQVVSQVFFEIDSGKVINCASGRDRLLTLLLSCTKVGGLFNQTKQTCDMEPVSLAAAQAAYARAKTYLDTTYRDALLNQAQQIINAESATRLATSVGEANANTDQVATALNATIVSNTATANTAVTQVNDTLNQDVQDLTGRIAANNDLTARAQGVVNDANQTSALGRAVAQSANAQTAVAQSYVDQAYALSNQANATSNAANQVASSASATAAQAEQTSGAANATSGGANSLSASSNAVASQANGVTTSASGVASSANNYATSALGLASAANGVSDHSIGTSNAANQVTASANDQTSNAGYWASVSNYWYGQWAGRQSGTAVSNNYVTVGCETGGASCVAQGGQP